MSKKEVVSTLYVWVELTQVPDFKLRFTDETTRLEVPVKLADRSEELEVEMNSAVTRKNPTKCEVCQDIERKKCKKCGCFKFGEKNDPDTIRICDECQDGFDWYCSEGKNDGDIIKAGESLKESKKVKN